MNKRTLTGFRTSGWAYVCTTWVECRANNLMWQAIAAEIHHLSAEWECGCGKPMNVRIHVDEARKAVSS